MKTLLTKEEALEAIEARVDGAWDNLALIRLGPLNPDPIIDIREILKRIKP